MIPLQMLDRPVAFHPAFRRATRSTVAAIMLSQALYWTNRLSEDRNGWFYKTIAEWESETALSRAEQETARRVLKGLNILEEKRVGLDATVWFHFDWEVLAALITRCGNPASGDEEIPHQQVPESSITPSNIDYVHRPPENTSLGADAPQPIPPKTSPEKSRSGTSLSENSNITARMLSDAKARGYDQPATLQLYDQFKDHHLAKGSVMKNWDAAFRTWMANDQKWSANRSQSRGGNFTAREDQRQRTMDYIDRQIAQELHAHAD